MCVCVLLTDDFPCGSLVGRSLSWLHVCVCVCASDRRFPLWQSGRQKFVLVTGVCVCVCVLLSGYFPCGALVGRSLCCLHVCVCVCF